MLHTQQSPRGNCVRRFGGLLLFWIVWCCLDERATGVVPPWAFARQMGFLSGVRHSSPFVQSTYRHSLGYSGYCPGHSPDKRVFCLVFGILRLAFSRQIDILSGVPDTVLGVRPTKERSVGCSAFSAFRSVDRSAFSRLFRIPSWAFARQIGFLSGV